MRVWLFIFFLFLSYIKVAISQKKPVYFRHLSLEKGLSQSSVHCVIQDQEGFLWIGTSDGLNCYDGSNIRVYRHNPQDSTTLSNGVIYALYEDKKGNIWVGTYGGGLSLLNKKKKKFTRFLHHPSAPLSLSHNNISAIYEDRQGNFWIATWGGGLNLMDREKNTFYHFVHDSNNPHSLSSNIVKTIYEDREGNLWIGTYGGGLCLMNRQTATFTTFKHIENDPKSLPNNFIFAIYEDRQGNFWVGTDGGGLCLMDRKKGTFKTYTQNAERHSLSNNRIRCLLEDSKGNFWVGTHGGGLDLFDRKNQLFYHHYTLMHKEGSISDNSIRCLYEDNQQNVWVGTWSGGLNQIDYKTNHFIRIEGVPVYSGYLKNINMLNYAVVRGIYEDKNGNLWIATDGGGLNFLERKTMNFKHYVHDEKNPYSIGSNRVWFILPDEKENLWVATDGGGLNYFDVKKERFTRFMPDSRRPLESLGSDRMGSLLIDKEGILWIGTDKGLNAFNRLTMDFKLYRHDASNPQSLSYDDIGCLYEDSEGMIWVGTEGGGLNKFDKKTETFTRYLHQKENPHSLSNNRVYAIHEDRTTGIFWIGTDIGLNAFDKKTEKFYVLTTNEGLPNNVIYSILPDNKGNLWISSNKGLIRFHHPKSIDELLKDLKNQSISARVKLFDIGDGLQSNEFSHVSYCRLRTGELAFGGVNGLNIFHPDSISDNPYPPAVYLLDLKINNQLVEISEESILKQDLRYTTHLHLTSEQNNLIFTYVGINFTLSHRNQYAYFLEGYDKDWKYVGNRQMAEYTNLPPGNYVFNVKASNNDGVWNSTPASIKITITPPIWQSFWFRTMLFLLITALGVYLYKWRINALKHQKSYLEQEVKKRTEEILKKNAEIERQKEELIQKQKQLEELNAEIITQNEELIQSREEILAQRDAIAQKNKQLEELNAEIIVQNEELQQNQEEIQAQRDHIQEKNRQLEEAQALIAAQNQELKETNAILEKKVQLRTRELHQAYQEMLRANKDLDHYIYRSSHDIKGPIARVAGLAMLGKIEATISAQQAIEYFDKIISCAKELEKMLAKIIHTHELKTKPIEIQEIDLYGLVWGILMEVSTTEDISGLQLTTDLTVDKMYTDGILLRAMLKNVITNAVQYRDRRKRNAYVRVATRIVGEKVIFTVRDNGIGIPKHLVKKVFDMFYRGTELSKGFGLGLYEAKIIAKKLKGQICINVSDNQETEFQMDVPINLKKSLNSIELARVQQLPKES